MVGKAATPPGVDPALAFHPPDKSAAQLQQSIDTFNGLLGRAPVRLGRPPVDEADWFPFERLAEEAFGSRVIGRIAEQTSATDTAAGMYTFRYAVYYPLLLAGFLFATERRVLALRGSLLVADREWLNHARLAEPAFAGGTADNEAALADALFAEMSRLVEPVITAWAERKWLGAPNAWASAIDCLAGGFHLAGRHVLGRDEAWAMWERVTAGRVFPVRRRPRRFLFTDNGEPDELLVGAGCCLWFTQASAKNGPVHYCNSCYILKDAQRLEQILAARQRQAAHA